MITLKNFVFNSFQVNSYILSDESKEAIIIDPACQDESELKEITNYLTEMGLRLIAIVNTHAHIDHILGVEALKKQFKVPFLLHADDSFLVDTSKQSAEIFGFNFDTIPTIDKFVKENETIRFGNSSLQALHIPGHSPGSLVYYSEESKFVIAGDVLFSGSIGRTDLPGGDYNSLITGIKEKLLGLPADTVVYCGHGPSTTIGKEHDTNPFLV